MVGTEKYLELSAPSEAARDRISKGGFLIPSPGYVISKKTPAGGWTATQLAEWGIAWPPEPGWRSYLRGLWHWEGSVIHDTVFDEPFCAKWLGVRSGRRVPLDNVRPMT